MTKQERTQRSRHTSARADENPEVDEAEGRVRAKVASDVSPASEATEAVLSDIDELLEEIDGMEEIAFAEEFIAGYQQKGGQ